MELSLGLRNPQLFEQKKTLIKKLEDIDLSQYPIHDKKQLSLFGLELNLVNYQDSDFFSTIEKFYPASWWGEFNTNGTQVHLLSCEDLGMSSDEFENELMPDCIDWQDEMGHIGIQRDFIGLNKNDNQIIIITGKGAGDGWFNFLRWYLPRQLLKNNQVILHSSAVVKNGQAYVFLGHSGAGKSTVTELSPDGHVLGDDMNFVEVSDGQLYARSGGIGGRFFPHADCSESFPVKAFFWLNQSSQNKIYPFSKIEGVRLILASMTNIFWETLEEKERQFAFDFAIQMNELGRVYKLDFEKKPTFWEVIDDYCL